MTRSVLQNLALMAGALVIFLGGAEGFFRLFPQFLSEEAQLRLHWKEADESASAQPMTAPNPTFGYLFRPHFSGRIDRGDLDFTFHTDEYGFRNPSPWPKQADIVVVGDSIVFSYGVDDQQAWPRLLAKALPVNAIINLGIPGFGPQQYLRLLESFGLKLHPKLVLFMLFPGNDLKDAVSFRGWLDAKTDLTYQEWQRGGGRPDRSGSWRQLLEASRLVTFLRGARKSLTSAVADSTIDFGDGRRVQLVPTIFRSEIDMAHPGDPAFELVMATIERARDATREHGSHLLVLLMPTKEEVYLPRIGEPALPLVESFREALDGRGICFIDLSTDFEAHSRDAAPLFFGVDGHPNADGYRLIALVVADHLKAFAASYGLPDRTRERKSSADSPDQRFAGAAPAVPRPGSCAEQPPPAHRKL